MADLNRPGDAMGLPIRKLTIEEFLEWEAAQPERYEYWQGEIFAMVGAVARHSRVVLNLAARLADHLDGTACQVFAEGMKLRLADKGILYPDVMVTCETELAAAQKWFTEPKVIVEVLSPSTQGYDRRDKFILYRTLESLQEYVLIDPESRQVEVFFRAEAGTWVLTDQTSSGALTLSSIDCEIPFDHLFKGTATPSA